MPIKGKYVRKPKGRKSKKAPAKKIPIAVKSYISKALAREEETKIVSIDYTLSSFNSGISIVADLIEVLPSISLGTSQNQRVGNKIKPIRLEITGYIVYLSDQKADARLIGARLLCFQDKQIRSYMNAAVNYNLLNLGGSSTNFTGTAANYISPHNKDNFTFYSDKRFKILKPYGVTNSATPSSTVSMSETNTTLFQPFKIILTEKHMPAYLQYDQTESTTHPVNFAPKLSLGYADLLNYSPDTTSLQLAMAFVATLYYKDS